MFFEDTTEPEEKAILKKILSVDPTVDFPTMNGLHMRIIKDYVDGSEIRIDNAPVGSTFKFADGSYKGFEWSHYGETDFIGRGGTSIKPVVKPENEQWHHRKLTVPGATKVILTSIPETIKFCGNGTNISYKDLMEHSIEEAPRYAKREIWIRLIDKEIDGDFYRSLMNEIEDEQKKGLEYRNYTIIKTEKATGKKSTVATNLDIAKARVLCSKIAHLPEYEYSVLEYSLNREIKAEDL